MTIFDVVRHLGVSWDVIKEIQKPYLRHHYLRPKLKALKHIAIPARSSRQVWSAKPTPTATSTFSNSKLWLFMNLGTL